MKYLTIKIDDTILKGYLHHQSKELRRNKYHWQPSKRPAILLLPGGGYLYISDSESEPIYPKPLIEVSLAIAYIRKHSLEFNIDSSKIAVCGLSAGGHLAGLISTQWQNKFLWEKLDIPYGENKPNALVLAYPLFDLKLYNNGDSNKGKRFGKMLWDENQNVNSLTNITALMPPTFIWHTRDDPIVPSNQSLHLAWKLDEINIPYELHMFYIGDHGLSTCNVLSLYGKYGLRDYPTNVSEWVKLSINWLNSLFLFDEFDPHKYK